MIEAKPDHADDLARAVGLEVTDIHHAAELIRTASDGEGLGTLSRAAALVELAAVRCRLENLFDRLYGANVGGRKGRA